MYDLIGDIHGHAKPLKNLLRQLGYAEIKSVWQHPERKVIFLGDYIDRGPAIRETLSIVHAMVQAGHSIALVGNHEYNALAYAYQLPNGDYLRKHSEKNTHQHKGTIKEFEGYEEEWQFYLNWFYTLPLFLDLPELRAVHACWDPQHIQWLKENDFKTLTKELLVASHVKNSIAYHATTEILKGKGTPIPPEYTWADKDGHPRTENRIRWWINAQGATYGDYLFDCPEQMKTDKIGNEFQSEFYSAHEPPLFIGHYWLEEAIPILQAPNIACLDYSIAKGGSLVAYRWNGEKQMDVRHYVSVS